MILPLCGITNAQTKTVVISKKRIYTISCKYSKLIDLDKQDTVPFVYLGFQNAKYSSITDIKSIVFLLKDDSVEVFSFVKDLKSALREMGHKKAMRWDREGYLLSVFESSSALYVYESKSNGSGYTRLSRKYVEKLIAWFEEIGFKK